MDTMELFSALSKALSKRDLKQILSHSGIFDEKSYLERNKDIAQNYESAIDHWIDHGYKELWRIDEELKNTINATLPPSWNGNFDPLLYYIILGSKIPTENINGGTVQEYVVTQSDQFDSDWYYNVYPDVKRAGVDAAVHYVNHGWREMRNPSQDVSTRSYIDLHPNSRNICPVVYYELIEKSISPTILGGMTNRFKQIIDEQYIPNIQYTGESDVRTFAFYSQIDDGSWQIIQNASPVFQGQCVSRIPNQGVGFYNSNDCDSFNKQVKLAKNAKICGFVFKIPLSNENIVESLPRALISNPDIDFEFSIMLTRDVKSESNPVLFLQQMEVLFRDHRYLRSENHPILIVDSNLDLEVIRSAMDILSMNEVELWAYASNAIVPGADAIIPVSHLCKNQFSDKVLINSTGVELHHYPSIVESYLNFLNLKTEQEVHPCVSLVFDNTSCGGKYSTYDFSFQAYANWLKGASQYTTSHHDVSRRIQFIDSWNDWCNRNVVEPDNQFGYAAIDFTARTLLHRPCNNQTVSFIDKDVKRISSTIKVAIHIHAFYPEILPELIKNLNLIPCKYDVFISTPSESKKEIVCKYMAHCSCASWTVEVLNNRGRDVAPFLIQMRDRIHDYDYICHIHTKKSKHLNTDIADGWRRYLLQGLFGTSANISHILDYFEAYPEVGLIYPEVYGPVVPAMRWGVNLEKSEKLFQDMELNYIKLPNDPEFPAGTMFWARVKAVMPLFDLRLTWEDFEEEAGQLDGTLAHSIERIWTYLVLSKGYIWVRTKSPIARNGKFGTHSRIIDIFNKIFKSKSD